MVTRLMALTDWIGRAGLWFGGALILLSAILIGIDVMLRKFLAVSIGGADELAGYALAIGTAWALAPTLLHRGHIRIDSLYMLLPVPLRVLLDFIGLMLFAGFFAMVFWQGIGVFEQSLAAGSRSQSALETPLILPQGIWLVGLALFILIAVMLFLAAITRLLRGDIAGLSGIIGTRSSAEDVTEEVRAAESRLAANDR